MTDLPLVDLSTLTPASMRFLGIRPGGNNRFWIFQISPVLLIEAWIGSHNQLCLRQAPALFCVGSSAVDVAPPALTGFLASLDIPRRTAARLLAPEATAESMAEALCTGLTAALGPVSQGKIRLLTETAAWYGDALGLYERVGFAVNDHTLMLLRQHHRPGTGPRLPRLNIASWLRPARVLSGTALVVPRDLWMPAYAPISGHARIERTGHLTAAWQEHGVDLADLAPIA